MTEAEVKEGKRLTACGAEVWRVRFLDKEGKTICPHQEEWFSPHGAEKRNNDDEWQLPKKVKVEESGKEDGEVDARKGGEDPSV